MKDNPLQFQAYPLQWPAGWGRTALHKRRRSRYQHSSFADNRDQLVRQVKLMGGRYVTISTNVPLRLDGLPYASMREPGDPGVAVYWLAGDQPQCIPCDVWAKVWENLRGCLYAVQSLRQLERCGAGEIQRRAFQGFKALPTRTSKDWRSVLGLKPGAFPTREELGAQYSRLVLEAHPDKEGGSHERMCEVNEAFSQALAELRLER